MKQVFCHPNLFLQVKKGLNDKTPVTKGSTFVWISSYHCEVWVLLAISDSQTEFSKKLTHNNSKTPFYFSFWFSGNLLHYFLEKLIFHSILLFLPPSPYIQCWIWFFGLFGWVGNIPWTNTSNIELEGGGEGLI